MEKVKIPWNISRQSATIGALKSTTLYRDVSLKEDKFRTKEKYITRIMATIRTLILDLLRRGNPKNLIAQMEKLQDNFDLLSQYLKKIRFL